MAKHASAGVKASDYTQLEHHAVVYGCFDGREPWMGWAAEEFVGLDLGDERLNRRLRKLAETFGCQPMASIPAACGGWGDTQGAYRFFAHEDIDWQDILAPHWRASAQRMAAQPVVLCIQDSTALDFNGQNIQGLGRLSYDAQRGMYLHPTYAVTPDREPLGVIDMYMWARPPKEEKDITESTRWIEGYERVAEQAAALSDTRLVYVADREGDILDLMQRAAALNHPADWQVRAQHDRKLPQAGKLWAHTTDTEPLGEFVLRCRRVRVSQRVRSVNESGHGASP